MIRFLSDSKKNIVEILTGNLEQAPDKNLVTRSSSSPSVLSRGNNLPLFLSPAHWKLSNLFSRHSNQLISPKFDWLQHPGTSIVNLHLNASNKVQENWVKNLENSFEMNSDTKEQFFYVRNKRCKVVANDQCITIQSDLTPNCKSRFTLFC